MTMKCEACLKRAVRPDLIVEVHIAPPLLDVKDGLVGMEIDLFIFEISPQPLDEDIVAPPSSPIHTDLNPVVM